MATQSRVYVPRTSGLSKREFYERQASALKPARSSFDGHWQELDHFVKPRRARFFTTDKNSGERRNKHILDNTATYAHRTLQSGMHAGITSPARVWFLLTTPDPDLAEFPAVKEWLYIVSQRMRTILGQTNIYGALPTMYGDMGLFGTGCMGIFESPKNLLHFQPFAVGSYWLGVDGEGVVNTFCRETSMTVWQLIEQFGVTNGKDIDRSKFSATVLNLWDQGEYEQKVDVVSLIAPNRTPDATRGSAKYFPWASCWFEKGGSENKFLRESGYREFPIIAPRWDVTDGDVYGTDCPGMQALGGTKALQIMQKRKAQGIEKLINPPLQAPPEMRQQKVSVIPGDVSYVATREASGGIRPIYEVRPDLSAMVESLLDERALIKEAFHANLFSLLSSDARLQPKTAEEIRAIQEEKVFILGPMLERVQGEGLKPLIDRVFAGMLRAGLIPEPPRELQGVNLKVEFTSVLSAALKSAGIAMQDRFVQSVAYLVEFFPEVRHKVSAFQLVDTYGDMTGIDPRIVRSDEDAQQSLEAEQQAVARQAQAEQMQRLGAAGKSLSEASMEGDTALSRLIGGDPGEAAA